MTRTPTEYEAHKSRMRDRSFELSRQGRDIGHIPPVRNPKRKREATRTFRAFCELYFPNRFKLEWSDHHLTFMTRVDQVVFGGGLHAFAMPRGEGKSTLAELVIPWAELIGAHHYGFLIGNSKPKALELLDSIKMELSYNDLLFEDFPEVCYPIRKLEGQPLRAKGQTHHGIRTEMKWSPDEIRLPTIPGSPASGASIKCAGIEGDIRGAVKTLPDGSRVRPTIIIIDDPQTDESARSPAQCQKRHEIINGGVVNMAGAGNEVAAIMPCTVIEEGDLSDRMLDRTISPDWTGERTSMVISFPENDELWERYNQLRIESLERHDDIRLATEFYRDNQSAMDKGAVVSWPARFNPRTEISAIQHAMNLLFRDERAFYAEYQNKPKPRIEPDAMMLSVEEIRSKTNNHQRGLVPFEAEVLVAHVDVQLDSLWFALVAFAQGFSGWIVDYGAWPTQTGDYYTLQTLKKTLSTEYPKLGSEGRWYSALETLVPFLAKERKIDGDRGTMRCSRILIDAAYGQSTDTVFKYCRESKATATVLPVFGRAIGAAQRPMDEYEKKRGERVGLNWKIPTVARKRAIRHGIYDTNFWKSFTHQRLSTPMGEAGTLTLYEPDRSKTAHRMIAEQLTSEARVETQGRNRRVDEWIHPDRSRDNHLFDNIVGAHVAASMEGITMDELQSERRRRRSKKKLSEIQSDKRRGVA